MAGRRKITRGGKRRIKRGATGPRKKQRRAPSPDRRREEREEAIPKRTLAEYVPPESDEEEEDVMPSNQLLTLLGRDRDQGEDVLSSDSEEDLEGSDSEVEEDVCSIHTTDEEEKNDEVVEDKVDELEDPDEDQEESDVDIDEKDDDDADDECREDPFYLHWERQVTHDAVEVLSSKKRWNKNQLDWKHLGHFVTLAPHVAESERPKSLALLDTSDEEHVPPHEIGRMPSVPQDDWMQPLFFKNNILSALQQAELTGKQKELLTLMCNNLDVYYPEQTVHGSDKVQLTYAAHVLNHVLKARQRVKRHDQKKCQKRDQGLVRPRVLILLPFRSSALKLVRLLKSLHFPAGTKQNVAGLKRIEDDYGGDSLSFSRKKPKPDDYQATFSGNIDDDFRIGISLSRKSMKLYSDFYSSDIILASPLGLRRVVGAPGEKERDWDFLSSLEILVLDQADVLLMQNWDHTLLLLENLHLQPKQQHEVDFARVRLWALEGHSKYYRQTMVFSSINCPELQAVFTKHCGNFAGYVQVANRILVGSICEVSLQLPQVFLRFEVSGHEIVSESRLNFFRNVVLPDLQRKERTQVLLVVSNYLDFVRVRSVLRMTETRFLQASEYIPDGRLARARNLFYRSHRRPVFLLYSERCHFFRRLHLKGVSHVVFYQLPLLPRLYSQICNLMHPSLQNPKSVQKDNPTCTAIFCKYDFLRLAAVVGAEKASAMLQSDARSHLLVSGDDP